MFDRCVTEEYERRPPKLYHDLRIAHWHALSRSQVEGHVRPAPVVDKQFDRDERLGARIGCDVRLGAVGGYALAIFGAVAVLAAYGAAKHVFVADGLNRMQDLGLLVP